VRLFARKALGCDPENPRRVTIAPAPSQSPAKAP
jgi:hypothetical protein